MYYSSANRIRRMQDILERIAYISVGADILIAGSTYLVLRNVTYSHSLLMLSDYLDFVLVAMIIVIFMTVFLLRFSLSLDKRFRLFMFKVSHRVFQ